MANYQQKPNSGAVFKNKDKTEDRHPDYKGKALIDGNEYWVSGWLNTPKGGGTRYLSLSFQPKDDNYKPSASTSKPSYDDFDDDTPF